MHGTATRSRMAAAICGVCSSNASLKGAKSSVKAKGTLRDGSLAGYAWTVPAPTAASARTPGSTSRRGVRVSVYSQRNRSSPSSRVARILVTATAPSTAPAIMTRHAPTPEFTATAVKP